MVRLVSARSAPVGLMLLTLSVRAFADTPELTAGQAAYERAEFADAEAHFERVLREESVGRSDLSVAHAYLFTLAHASGDETSASAHAEAALALDPTVRAPPSAPPSAVALLDRERARRAGRPSRVAVRFTERIVGGARIGVRAEATDTPPALAGQLHLRCRGQGVPLAEGRPVRSVTAELTLAPVSAGTDVTCEAFLSTPEGVVVDRASVRATAAIAPGSTATSTSRRSNHGLLYLGIGAGAAIVATAAVIAVILAKQPDQASLGAPRFEQ